MDSGVLEMNTAQINPTQRTARLQSRTLSSTANKREFQEMRGWDLNG